MNRKNFAALTCALILTFTLVSCSDESFGSTQSGDDGWDHNFIIKGKSGSAAEKYAKDNDLKFVAI